MNIPVKYLNFNKEAPDNGYWDQHFLTKILSKSPFKTVDTIGRGNCAVIVVPGRQNTEYVGKINNYINQFDGVVLIVTGDEESIFPIDQIQHSNIKIWLMTPRAGAAYPNVDRFIGEGYTPHTDSLDKSAPEKSLRWFFAGQKTHPRRTLCLAQLEGMKDGELISTEAFAAGIDPKDYIKKMQQAKVVPCPGGPTTPDTFRFYEALEAGCIPLADAFSANNRTKGFWEMLYGQEYPFPVVENWIEVPDLINYYNDVFRAKSNEIFAWWQMYKRKVKLNLLEDFASVAKIELSTKGITAIVPTSPTKLHPDISIIEETISSIRIHHPNIPILITFDGVRPEQEHLREQYEEYTRRLLWKCNREWNNVFPLVFKEHMHQVAMAREALKHVYTDQILYVEHDTPLTPDMSIEWDKISYMLYCNDADLIRFHYESFIPDPHKHLILDNTPQSLHDGLKMVRTIQWSQRPHLTTKKFYERILRDHFSSDAKTFIEDKMHSVVIDAYKQEQLQGWNKFKLWIYHPNGGNIKRSYHLDGRAGEQKYEMKF